MKNSRYKQFIFEHYHMDYDNGEFVMHFSYDGERKYIERVHFSLPDDISSINKAVVDAVCFYTFIIAGTSYYKSFLAPEMVIQNAEIDYWQADFFNMIYSGGLSQFIYENKLAPKDIAQFEQTGVSKHHAVDYDGEGLVLMQSGGKDSLLSSELLAKHNRNYISWHMSTTGQYPPVLDQLGVPVVVSKRQLDIKAIEQDKAEGGLNGHIPFSALFAGFGLIQAALLNREFVIASNESSADEANIVVDGYKVNHQFSKTFAVELAISEYLHRYVSEELHYGSLLRPLNELEVSKLFAKYAWPKYRHNFSSCNLANYKQGSDDGNLTWDGTCPKCANLFVLMAPFVERDELLDVFSGKNLLVSDDMTETYRQLFGLSDVKPFECVGTFAEMRQAYRLATAKDPAYQNSAFEFADESTEFERGPYQDIFDELIDYQKLQ